MASPRALKINGKGIVLKEIVLNPHQVEMLGIAPKQNLTDFFFFFFFLRYQTQISNLEHNLYIYGYGFDFPLNFRVKLVLKNI